MSLTQKFHTAVRCGDTATMRALLEEHPTLVHAQGDWGRFPLHLAARFDQLPATRMLVEYGAALEVREDQHGFTPLAWSAVLGPAHTDLADFLLRRGAALDIFSAVALGRLAEIEGMLRGSRERAARSQFLMFVGKRRAVRQMVRADPNVLNARMTKHDDGLQPLHLAVLKNRPEVVEFLVRAGADLGGRSETGRTPLCLAASEGRHGMVDLLLNLGAEIDLDAATALSRMDRPAGVMREYASRPARSLTRRSRPVERMQS